MAGGGSCYLNGVCCDGNQTGKQEGVGFTHTAGGAHNVIPFLTLCTVKITITPQIYEGGTWIDMFLSTKIVSSSAYEKTTMSRPCVKNVSFTLTPQTGSGGATYDCRYKVSDKTYTYYCTFTVQVDAPLATFHQSYQTHTP